MFSREDQKLNTEPLLCHMLPRIDSITQSTGLLDDKLERRSKCSVLTGIRSFA